MSVSQHIAPLPGPLRGVLTVPASKSMMQRACAAALLRGGETVLHNPGHSNDDFTALSIIEQMGAAITNRPDGTVMITSSWAFTKRAVDMPLRISCGESGLSFRMFTSIAALMAAPVEMIAYGSLTTRPMRFFEEVLPGLGVAVQSDKGLAPVKVSGPLKPLSVKIDGSVSSQYLTGLLLAYASLEQCNATISVEKLASRPYIDLTLKVIRDFGLNVPENHDYRSFTFRPEKEPGAFRQLDYFIESDWSNGAFWLVAGALSGHHFTLKGLNTGSFQGDRAILDVVQSCGAGVTVEEDCLIINKAPELIPFKFDATDCPDLFPPLVVLAAFCRGTSVINGVHRLLHKESNRAATLRQEFSKTGLSIAILDDEMYIHGGEPLHSATLDSHNDHRIAMAGAIAGLMIKGGVTIENAEAVKKSYPDFWRDLKQMTLPDGLIYK